MDEPFIIRALLAGIGIAIFSCVLGCFVIWRRMAYFGESLAHSSLLGVTLGLLFGMGINLGAGIVCFIFSLVLIFLGQKRIFSSDALLGIISHTALSLGLISLSLVNYLSIDIQSYLFGDILTVTRNHIVWIYTLGFIILTLLIYFWPSLMLMSVSEELARAEGVHTFYMHALLMFLMTLTIAISLQIVGILLITSLLIIPPATARLVSTSPKMMAIISCLIGIGSVVGGILFSLYLDTPSGPSIVVFAAISFIFMVFFRKFCRFSF